MGVHKDYQGGQILMLSRSKNESRRSNLKYLFFISLALLAVPAWTANSATPAASATVTQTSPYPVLDSGAWADWHGYVKSIYWIDDTRVVFKTVKDNDKSRVSSGPFNLSVWEIGKGVQPYTDFAKNISVCVSEGNIRYVLVDDKKNMKGFYGKFGNEKPFEFPKTKGAFFNELDCRPSDNPEILAKRQAGRAIKPLLSRHGYLDIGPIQWERLRSKEPVVLYRLGETKGIELPILAKQTYNVRYYPFKGAYLIYGLNYGGGIRSKKLWWLYPDGKVEEHSIPVETDPYPTKKGVVTNRGLPAPSRDTSAAGLYLWDSKGPINLLPGYAKGIEVSPDGCKLAFSHHLYSDATLIKDPAPINLKIINLCPKETNNG
jgi:hypothetical protein